MSNTNEKLVYMANQIARAFDYMGGEKAVLATADHIKMYWDPRMIEGIKTADRSGLSSVAEQALAIVHQPVEHMTQGTQFASVDETDSGFNDAG